MKVRLAGVQLVAGADAGEEAVGQADRRALGRHVAADLRQQRDQRHLADVRALAGHVRAGDQSCSESSAPKLRVVGDELAAELLLEHRVAAVDDLQHALLDDRRAGSSAAPAASAASADSTSSRASAVRQFLERRDVRQQRLADLLEQRLLQRDRPVLRAQRLAPRTSSTPAVMYRSALLAVCLRVQSAGALSRWASVTSM